MKRASDHADPSVNIVPKRFVFFLLMLAIPVVVATGLYFGYRALRAAKPGESMVLEPRAWLAGNPYVRRMIDWFSYQYNSIGIDKARMLIEEDEPELIKEKGKEYEDNLAEALAFVPVPGVTANLMPNVRGKYLNTNDLGYRSPLNYLDQIAEAKRLRAQGVKIAVLTGGSAAFGLYSDDDRTDIVGYMNRSSVADGGRIRFYNFANAGYTSAEELNALVNYASALEPDLLIVFDGFNDALRLTEPVAHGVAVGVPYAYPSLRAAWPTAFRSAFLDRTYDVAHVSPAQEAEFFENYQRSMRLMATIMAGSGGHMVLATQPVAYFRNPCNQVAGGNPFFENLAAFYPKLISAARRVSATNGITYLDLTGVFERPQARCQDNFSDSVHMRSAGQKVIAEHLYRAAREAMNATSK